MPLRDFLKRKDDNTDKNNSYQEDATSQPPRFTFIRSTTDSQEVISPPHYPGDATSQPQEQPSHIANVSKRHSLFNRQPSDDGSRRSFGDKFGWKGSRSRSSSAAAHSNLPEPKMAQDVEDEAEWEQRATMLVKSTASSRPSSPGGDKHGVADEIGDVNIQEAIRLHEAGDLARATEMFGRLANPRGANNALSQVLYGLALRHGWGCAKNEAKAVEYLSLAANNSAEVEALALAAGKKKGGAAKGELTLAMFELANCYRNGWGVKRDPASARNFYETAANLGDTDAMNEAAWCYMEGYGCKKDKFKAAQYLRRAESLGKTQPGNSWIYKDKYGGPREVVK